VVLVSLALFVYGLPFCAECELMFLDGRFVWEGGGIIRHVSFITDKFFCVVNRQPVRAVG